MNNQNFTLEEIIKNYKEKIISLNNKYLSKNTSLKNFMLCKNLEKLQNEDLYNIKLIVIGDNPSMQSVKTNTYFEGSSGSVLRVLLRLLNFKDEEFIFFNKTSFSTSATRKLRKCYNSKEDNYKYEIDKDMKSMALAIKRMINLNPKIKLYIFGYAGLVSMKKLFSPFYNTLFNRNEQLLNNTFVFPHPSPKSGELFDFIDKSKVYKLQHFEKAAYRITLRNDKAKIIIKELKKQKTN